MSSEDSDSPQRLAGVAEVRFYAELNDHLPDSLRFAAVALALDDESTVAGLLTSAGVPLSEVDLVLRNGEPARFDDHVAAGDRLSVYPVFETFDIGSAQSLRPQPLRTPLFVLDVHLGKLASFLRMLGFDAAYSPLFSDEELVTISLQERRVLLSNDRALLRDPRLERASTVEAHDAREQIREVVRRFSLEKMVRPLTRCLRCNALLTPIAKPEVIDRLPPRVRDGQERFTACPECRRVYWEGTHHQRMMQFITSLVTPPPHPDPGCARAPLHDPTDIL